MYFGAIITRPIRVSYKNNANVGLFVICGELYCACTCETPRLVYGGFFIMIYHPEPPFTPERLLRGVFFFFFTLGMDILQIDKLAS